MAFTAWRRLTLARHCRTVIRIYEISKRKTPGRLPRRFCIIRFVQISVVADCALVADSQGGMAIHALSHQHFPLNHRGIGRLGFIAVAGPAPRFQSAVFKFSGHYHLVAEIHEVGLLCPGGPWLVGVLVRIEHRFFSRGHMIICGDGGITRVALGTLAHCRKTLEPPIVFKFMAGGAVFDVIFLNVIFMHKRDLLDRIRLHNVIAGCPGDAEENPCKDYKRDKKEQ
jgi:hypothetical protein